MLIDWFTVGAQALNFVILVWLMKRFLYKPILHAIDAREKRIAAVIQQADAKRAEAQEERAQFERKNQELDRQRAALLAQAKDEANAERQRLISEAREAAQTLSAKRQRMLRDEARDLRDAIGRQTRTEVFAVARKALSDLATTSLEDRMSEVFTRRLREMDGEAKARLAAALSTPSEPAVVRSAFELSTQQRAEIQEALHDVFSADVHVQFEKAPELIGGLELAAHGQKVAWSIDDYLGALEARVGTLLSKGIRPGQEVEADSPPGSTGEAHDHGP